MFNKLKENILYYIINYYYNSFIYNKYVIPILWFNKDLNNFIQTKDEAFSMLNRKKYRYVSKFYMIKKINEKFK